MEASISSGTRTANGSVTISWPVDLGVERSFGNDSYGEFVHGVHLGSGNFVEQTTDVSIETVGPDLVLTRSYNSLDSVAGTFGRGWSSSYEARAQVGAGGVVTIVYGDGRRETHTPNGSGGFVVPKSYASTLTNVAGGGWLLRHKDDSTQTFDAAGLLVGTADAYGRALAFAYTSGQLTSVTDLASWRSLTFSYDGTRVSSVATTSVNGPGHSGPLVWNYEYTGDLLTRVCDARDPNLGTGLCTVYGYTNDRLTSVTRPDGTVAQTLHYRPSDNKVDWSENGEGDRVEFSYGDFTAQVRDGRGYRTTYFFDPLYRTTQIIDPALGSLRYEYDAAGFRSKVIDPLGNVETMTYDARGNLVSSTNGEGETRWMSYDTSDNLLWQSDGRSAGQTDTTYRTTFTYNAAGDRLTQTTPATAEFPTGVTSVWTYTNGGEDLGWGPVPAGLLRSSNPGTGATTMLEYDSDGDMRRRLDPSGLITVFDHDSLGRVVSTAVTWNGGSSTATTSQTWSQLSGPLTTTDPPVTNGAASPPLTHQKQTTNVYDDNGELERTVVSDVGGSPQPTPDRITILDRDLAGRVITTTDPENGVTTRTYDDNGNVATVTDAEGRTYRTAYDELNRPVTLTLEGFVDDPVSPGTPRDVVLHRWSYDAAGRVVAEFDPAPGTGGRLGQLDPAATAMRQTTTVYDRADRVLSTRLIGYHNRVGVAPATRDVQLGAYTYDDAGNRTVETTGGGLRTVTNVYDQASRLQTATLELGAIDQVADFDYDEIGQPIRKTVTEGASVAETRYGYDSADRLVSTTVENGATDLVTTVGYDERGLTTSTVDPRGNAAGSNPADFETSTTYDAVGRAVAVAAPPVSIEAVGGTAVVGRPTTLSGYDAVGNRTDVFDARGNRTTSTYDRLERVVRIDHPAYTPPGGATLTPFEAFTFDHVGNLLSRQDRRGQVTDFTFDARNRVARQLDPLVTGQPGRGAINYSYDDAGNRTRTVDQTGATTLAGYDDLGRLRTATQVVSQPIPAEYTTTSDYDDLGNVVYRSDPTSVTTTATFDAASRQRTSVDALGKTTTFGYDAAGRNTSIQDPLARVTEHVFDPAGRETSTVRRDGPGGPVLATTYQDYDHAGNLTASRSARSASSTDSAYLTSFGYDALNRLESVTQPDAIAPIVTTAGYDANGNMTRFTDGRGNTATHAWNEWNLRSSTTEPAVAGQTVTWATSYDAAGLPIEEAQPGPVTIARTFDDLGRLTDVSGSGTGVGSAAQAFGYDLAGRRTSIGSPAGTVTFDYDDRGLVLESSVPGGTAPAALFDYDPAGRMTSRTDAAGVTSFTYTSRGELDHVTDPLTGGVTDYGWNDAGQVDTVSYGAPAPAVRSLTYDRQGRLDLDTLTPSSGSQVVTDYAYDPDGNVTTQSITAPGNPSAGGHSYTYDQSGRLDTWSDPSATVTDYTYDAAGNRTAAGSSTYVYDERNRLTSAVELSGTTTYTWSPRGTLEAVDDGTVTDVVFDALGRQTATGDATYAYDDLDRVISRDPDGAGPAPVEAFAYAAGEIDPVAYDAQLYARTPGGELAASEVSGDGRFALANRHGDLATLIDPAGAVTNTRTWDPYGQPLGTTGSNAPALGYQEDWTDPATEEVWMGARWYQPSTATFTSRDTVFGQLQTPMTVNRYTYANGDPLEYFDPDGNWAKRRAQFSDADTKGVRRGGAGGKAKIVSTRARTTASSRALLARRRTQNRATHPWDHFGPASSRDDPTSERYRDLSLAEAYKIGAQGRLIYYDSSDAQAAAWRLGYNQRRLDRGCSAGANGCQAELAAIRGDTEAAAEYAALAADDFRRFTEARPTRRSPSLSMSNVAQVALAFVPGVSDAVDAYHCASGLIGGRAASVALDCLSALPAVPSVALASRAVIDGFDTVQDGRRSANAMQSVLSATGGSHPLSAINPTGDIVNNCGRCAVALDATLGGSPASALPGGPHTLQEVAQAVGQSAGTWGAVRPHAGSIIDEIANAGSGARGIVFGGRGAPGSGQIGHFFNVMNQRGTVRFLDGQSGEVVSDLSGFNWFALLRTDA